MPIVTTTVIRFRQSVSDWTTDWITEKFGVSFLVEPTDFSPFRSVHTGSDLHRLELSPVRNRPGLEADPSPIV